jgi:hypothetical protein
MSKLSKLSLVGHSPLLMHMKYNYVRWGGHSFSLDLFGGDHGYKCAQSMTYAFLYLTYLHSYFIYFSQEALREGKVASRNMCV